jgi:formylglycine-generating enzyme required for sulfatase activity
VGPAILGGGLGDRRTWTARTMTPGRDSIAALGDALGGLPAVGAALSVAEGGQLPAALARHLAIAPDRGLVIFVDQLEELVTQNPPALAARAAEILAALGAGLPGIKVILAVRGDFFTRVAALPGLRAVATRSLHLVRGLSPDDAREAVESPARAKGVQLETRAMVDALVASVADRPAALPLLQFALSELWKRRDIERAVIPERALADIGGVSGALASYADQMLTALAAPERTAARRVLLALVTAEGTRASRVRSELVVAGDEATAAALEALVTGRLVVARDVADGPPVYELAHESLLNAWGTLRGWLDDAAGQRGIRTRLSAAADEWQRLHRPRELLWRRSQLAEAAHLEDLTAGDRAFLAASRRNARLRAALAVALAFAIPAAAALTWWGAARARQQRDEQTVMALLHEARDTMWAAKVKAAQARRIQADAIAQLHPTPAPAWTPPWLRVLRPMRLLPSEKKPEVRERQWDNALQLFADARRDMSKATNTLERALPIGVLQAAVRDEMAAALYDQAVLADHLRDEPAVRGFEQRLAGYDGANGLRVARWNMAIAVSIHAEGARRIELARYRNRPDGSKLLEPATTTAERDRLVDMLTPGSYRAQVWAPGIAPVLVPFVVRRGQPVVLDVELPRPGDVADGFAYVPAGRFLQGTDDHLQSDLTWMRRNFLRATPLHEETTGAYLIGIYEVTFAQWLAYLRSLSPKERTLRTQHDSMKTQRALRLDLVKDKYELRLHTVNETFKAAEGVPLVYGKRDRNKSITWENTPVGGVTLDDAESYAGWLATSGKVPHARLCTPFEWERAARGADGRRFPHGDRMLRDDANIDETYYPRGEYPGPDEVGSHPASVSPFGIQDMSGNIFEWIRNASEVTLRGGTWAQGPTVATTMNISYAQASRHEAFVGIRICADLPARH